MEQTLNKKKVNYLILVIKLLILLFFIFVSVKGYQETIFELDMHHSNRYKVTDFIRLMTRRTYFRPSLLLLLPLIGIFANKKIGWIFITSYFYFLLTRLVFSTISNGLNYNEEIMFFAIALILILLFIWIMNRKKIFEKVYSLKKNEVLITNIKAFSLGIFLTLYLAWTQMI
ncbi:hypothetical protein D1818_09710 [Aquimarina sp. BL5]|uniref:hypothetical protein n=1 Tax=Aquimarina sp. BL5 TaxID=1714860 RepID=UPI000E5341D6|nr:hypothetical protein [Aquimarina sp. BL5]AXT51087.1 hypothetical protein D1818_09710 [Aquimarina sp. BL5]RKN06055.1 hypothetical protein D7036_09680 [Aquimarina sp. BL5]